MTISKPAHGSTGWDTATNALIDFVNHLPWVDIRDFGAQVNGSTDDTTSIQSAIDSFSTAGSGAYGTGGVVLFPVGFTRTSAALKVPTNVHLRGHGYSSSVIQLLPNSNCNMIETRVSTGSGNANAYWCSVRDLMLDGRRDNQGSIFTDATLTAGSTTITSASAHTFTNGEYLQGVGILPGTTVVSGGGTHSAVMSQAATASAGQNGNAGAMTVQVGGPYHGIYHTTNPYNTGQTGDPAFDPTHLFENLRIYKVCGDGIKSAGRSDCRIRNVKVTVPAGNAFSLDFDNSLSGCMSEYAQGSGLEIAGHSSNHIGNCKFYNSYGYGVYIHGSANGDISLANLDLQQNNLHAVRIDGQTGVIAQALGISQPGFLNDGIGASGTGAGTVPTTSTQAAVSLNDAVDCVIDAAAGLGKYGLQITGSSSGNDIRLTDHSTVSGAARLTSDTITLPGSSNSVMMNGVSLTDTVAGLTDVALSSPSAGQVLAYNAGTGKWNNSSAGGTFYSGVFGDGSDGSVTLDGSATFSGMSKSGSVYTMTRDQHTTSLTVNSGVTLNPDGYRIFCQGTVSNAGTIGFDGNNGSASGTAGAATDNGTLASGGAGGAGNTGNGSGGNTPTNGSRLGMNASGAGGAGATGSAGGAAFAANGGNWMLKPVQVLLTGTVGWVNNVFQLSGGVGGGGGGGDATNKGGGGGSGGGVVAISAHAVTNTGTISAKGGNGGTPTTGNCGGGGGGSGGLILVYTLSAWTAGTTAVTGGTAGSGVGTGSAGSAGGNGSVLNVVLA